MFSEKMSIIFNAKILANQNINQSHGSFKVTHYAILTVPGFVLVILQWLYMHPRSKTLLLSHNILTFSQ